MEWLYIVMIIACIAALLTMIVHVSNNTVLGKKNIAWFICAFISVIVAASAECAGYILTAKGTMPLMHTIITLIEFSVTPVVPVFLSLACNIIKPARILAIVIAAHAILELVLITFKSVFYITPDGIYHRGDAYIIYILAYLIAYVYLLSMFFFISKTFKNRDLRTLLMTCITAISALIPSVAWPAAMGGSVRTGFLGLTMLSMLLYIYYEGLSQQDLQKCISEHSEHMSRELIQTLSYALEAKDVYTKGHSMRVAEYTKIIAAKMGYSKDALDKLHFAATLHDIGKIGIPDTVLNKPGRLSDEEFSIIKMHPSIGADILKNVESIAYAEVVARYHHERYDGNGYPEHLKGNQIPVEARIVAIADTFDAMTSKRVYRRKPLSDDEIRAEIIKNMGTQFDPQIADIFLKAFNDGLLDPIRNREIARETSESVVDIGTAKGELFNVMQAIFGEVEEKSLTLDEIVDTVENMGKYEGALSAEHKEFARLFMYVDNLCRRYNHSCYVAMISLDAESVDEPTEAEYSEAMEAIDIAVHQTIRATDICTRFSRSQYLVILVEAAEDNVSVILKRIFNAYYKIQGRSMLVPRYDFRRIHKHRTGD